MKKARSTGGGGPKEVIAVADANTKKSNCTPFVRKASPFNFGLRGRLAQLTARSSRSRGDK
jgi:hypothetical protein